MFPFDPPENIRKPFQGDQKGTLGIRVGNLLFFLHEYNFRLIVLFQTMVLCFKLYFSNDGTTSNTSSAAIRQGISVVIDRMIDEDKQEGLQNVFLVFCSI